MKDEGEYHKTILGNTFTYADWRINRIRRSIKILSKYQIKPKKVSTHISIGQNKLPLHKMKVECETLYIKL